jgi:hypothetical protein
LAEFSQHGGNGRFKAGQGCLCNLPDPVMFDGGVAVDQDVAEGDDVTQVGNAAGQIRLTLRELVQRLSDDLEFALNCSGDHLVVCIGAGIKPCREPHDRIGRVLHAPQERLGHHDA